MSTPEQKVEEEGGTWEDASDEQKTSFCNELMRAARFNKMGKCKELIGTNGVPVDIQDEVSSNIHLRIYTILYVVCTSLFILVCTTTYIT